MRFICEFSGVYPYISGIMICCFGSMVWIMMASLKVRIISEIELLQLVSPELCYKKLTDYKRHFGLICEFNNRLSRGFSTVLFFYILATFVRTISNGFEALIKFKQDGGLVTNTVTTLLQSSHSLIYLSIFCYISHNIREEVLFSFFLFHLYKYFPNYLYFFYCSF